jgi:hypothetical protein
MLLSLLLKDAVTVEAMQRMTDGENISTWENMVQCTTRPHLKAATTLTDGTTNRPS